MKKIVLLTTLLVLAVAGMARAESISLGGNSISYEIPKGYVRTDDEKYSQVLSLIRQNMPKGLTVHTVYVSEEADREYKNAAESRLTDYIVISSIRQLAGRNITLNDFKQLKEQVVQSSGPKFDRDIQKEANALLKKNSGGRAQIGSMETLGTFGETDTRISSMQLVTSAGDTPQTLALVSTQLLTDGKLLIVTQYAPAKDADAVTDLYDRAPAVLNSMQFKEGAASRSSASRNGGRSSSGAAQTVKQQSSVWDYIWEAAVVTALCAILGGVVAYAVARRKRETKPGEKVDLEIMSAKTRETLQRLFRKDKTDV